MLLIDLCVAVNVGEHWRQLEEVELEGDECPCHKHTLLTAGQYFFTAQVR